MAEKTGYIALHRKIQDHVFYREKREFSKYEAWVDILMEVQHSEKPQDVVLGMDVLKCNYAESLKSIPTWAKRWNWSDSKVKRYFKLLKKLGQIDTKNEKITTRLKVLNYYLYDPKRTDSELVADCKRTGCGLSSDTDKNVNNEKNDNKYTPEIENFVLDFQKNIKEKFGKQAPQINQSTTINSIDTVDKLLRLDNYTLEYVSKVMEFALEDEFLSPNIRSLAQIRKKWKNGMTKFQNCAEKFEAHKKKNPLYGAKLQLLPGVIEKVKAEIAENVK